RPSTPDGSWHRHGYARMGEYGQRPPAAATTGYVLQRRTDDRHLWRIRDQARRLCLYDGRRTALVLRTQSRHRSALRLTRKLPQMMIAMLVDESAKLLTRHIPKKPMIKKRLVIGSIAGERRLPFFLFRIQVLQIFGDPKNRIGRCILTKNGAVVFQKPLDRHPADQPAQKRSLHRSIPQIIFLTTGAMPHHLRYGHFAPHRRTPGL